MADKVRRNHVITEDQDDWLDKIKKDHGIDKSWMVRRALKYYRGEGHKRDKMFKKKKKGEI